MLYLFVDGIAERLHLGQPREAVLAAWGITRDGREAAAGAFAWSPRRTRQAAGTS
ncbi:MAG: hypothetical protein RML56_04935 [Burkholderiales bacterium]|nr:hypothetical protein [Burkholderiales bacterium]